MKNVLVDTSVVYEIFLEDSVFQKTLSEHLETSRFFVNIHILDEVFTLFRARGKDDIAFRILDPLLSEELFSIAQILPIDVATAATVLKKYQDKKLSFTDALILAQAANQGFQIWTMDRAMQQTRLAPVFNQE